MKCLYVNMKKPRNVLSNMDFREYKVFEAHTRREPHFKKYIQIESFNELKDLALKLSNNELSINQAKEMADKILEGLDPIL